MFQIDITSNIEQVLREVKYRKAQIAYAISLALNNLAREVIADEKVQMAAKLTKSGRGRPTPFTLNSMAITYANKQKLVAVVFVKDIQAAYLKYTEEGGTVTPKSKVLVIPVNARLNTYGGLPKGYTRSLLNKKNTFMGTINGVSGIWQRQKRGLKLLIDFKASVKATPHLEWIETATKVVNKNADRVFAAALERALR